MRKKYYKTISKKCFNCEQSYFFEDYANKSDWRQYRKCGSCQYKIIALDKLEEPKSLSHNFNETEVKRGKDYYVFL